MSKTDNTSFEDFKNQVAVKHGFRAWDEMVFPLDSENANRLINMAVTLFVDSERKRIWDKACEAQLEEIRTGFEQNIDKMDKDAYRLVVLAISKTINKYPLAKFNDTPSNDESN